MCDNLLLVLKFSKFITKIIWDAHEEKKPMYNAKNSFQEELKSIDYRWQEELVYVFIVLKKKLLQTSNTIIF